jgi:hypothetical protein
MENQKYSLEKVSLSNLLLDFDIYPYLDIDDST